MREPNASGPPGFPGSGHWRGNRNFIGGCSNERVPIHRCLVEGKRDLSRLLPRVSRMQGLWRHETGGGSEYRDLCHASPGGSEGKGDARAEGRRADVTAQMPRDGKAPACRGKPARRGRRRRDVDERHPLRDMEPYFLAVSLPVRLLYGSLSQAHPAWHIWHTLRSSLVFPEAALGNEGSDPSESAAFVLKIFDIWSIRGLRGPAGGCCRPTASTVHRMAYPSRSTRRRMGEPAGNGDRHPGGSCGGPGGHGERRIFR